MTEDVIKNIGDRIRALRKENRLSIKKLAEMSGVSPAGIHKIENNMMVPTITVLMKLANALNRKVGYFVEEEVTRDVELVTRKERTKLYSSRVHVWIENLAGGLENGHVSAIYSTVNPKGSSGRETMSHRGEEMILVLQNIIEFNIEEKKYLLKKGDCLHFRSELAHSWRNPSEKQTKAFWVFAPAPFLL